MNKTPPRAPLVAPRSTAEFELQTLFDEIPTWPDAMLVHMYTRFSVSRLFRVHHNPDGPLTDRAQKLRATALEEMNRRGLSIASEDEV